MARQPVRRPTLLPTIRRLWRDHQTLQVGTDPHRAVVVELADPSQARLLDFLDGTHSERGVVRAAGRIGIPPSDTLAVLDALSAAGYLVDAHAVDLARAPEATRRRLATEAAALALRPEHQPAAPTSEAGLAMRRRLQAQVYVTGTPRLAVPIATILAASGIGQVDPGQSGIAGLADAIPGGLLPADAHRPRGVAAADALRRAAPELEVTRLRRGTPTFVVVVGFGVPASLTALSYGHRRIPYLAVTVRDSTVVVGPLVKPGRSACLNCLELHRRDLDPDWPAVAAQLHTGPDLAETVTMVTALAGVAFAAGEVLSHIDGHVAATVDATVEISGHGRAVTRQWSQHPRCGCRRRQRTLDRQRPGQREGGQASTVGE